MPRVTVRRKGTGKKEKETRVHPHANAAPRSSFDTDSSPARLSPLASRLSPLACDLHFSHISAYTCIYTRYCRTSRGRTAVTRMDVV
jgi:hypothetical protein